MTGPCALVVDALLAAGFVLNVTHDGHGEALAAPTADRAAILAALDATDHDHAYVVAYSGVFAHPRPLTPLTRSLGWVRLVPGNADPQDVINDFTLTLAPYIEPLTHRL